MFSESGKIIKDLIDAMEQYTHPALYSKAASDSRVKTAKEYIGSYKKQLHWELSDATLGDEFCATDIGVYYLVPELNNMVSLQFEGFVLAISHSEDKPQLKDQAEEDYILRTKTIKKVG